MIHIRVDDNENENEAYAVDVDTFQEAHQQLALLEIATTQSLDPELERADFLLNTLFRPRRDNGRLH